MLINILQRYLLGLVFATTLSANLQSVDASTTEPVDQLQGNATSLSTNQISTPTFVLDSTFAPLAITGLQILHSNQYEPNTRLIPFNHDLQPKAIMPNYDGGLFKDIDTMSQAMEAAVMGLTVSKYDKIPMAANKIFVSSQHESVMMIVSITSKEGTPISRDSQPNNIIGLPERNRSYVPNSQYLRRGTLVSTNYNAVSMLRTMEDLQNIGSLGMNEFNPQPISDALTRELKMTTHLAFVSDNMCVNSEDLKLPKTCQNKNAEKIVTAMPMMHDKDWSAQLNKDFSFWDKMNISTDVASK
ncbi:hypothetical protein IQ244_19170 [Nostoc sp. LEGE 06077]|uniref:hypothetical protein n=1 Tax=Nostoc sp. LEGE 06077 TaxID=915325 RepID=UPI00187EAD1D|nr:hypothetical protein [Nostoc sp. LEGE 06077]MBE9208619.1 hypothetical protein [Nostoc sp. LEGE 06077]